MRLRFAALACACICLPAVAQQPARPPGPVQPPVPAAPAQTVPAQTASAPAATAPVYRIELIVFRATSALGAPEDWSAEAGEPTGGPSASDADPANGATTGSTAPPPPASESAAPGAPTGSASSATTAQEAGAPGAVTQATAAPTGAAAAAAAAAAAQSADERSNVQVLSPSEFQLDRIWARLRSSARYSPVAHVAWSQTASPWGRPNEIPVQSLGIDAKGLTGSVALERGEFLHLALQLDYAMDDPPPGLNAAPGTVFILHDSHRVRLDERNYFDHPAFGVIALVTPERRAGQTPRGSHGSRAPLSP